MSEISQNIKQEITEIRAQLSQHPKTAIERLYLLKDKTDKLEEYETKAIVFVLLLQAKMSLGQFNEVLNDIKTLPTDEMSLFPIREKIDLHLLELYIYYQIEDYQSLEKGLNQYRSICIHEDFPYSKVRFEIAEFYLLIHKKEYQKAEQLIERVIKFSKKLNNKNLIARLKNNKATLFIDQFKFNEAIVILDDLYPVLFELNETYAIMLNKLNRGICNRNLNKINESQIDFEDAAKVATSNGFKEFINYIHLEKSKTFLIEKSYEKAFTSAYSAYRYFNKLSNKNNYLAYAILSFVEASLNLNITEGLSSLLATSGKWIAELGENDLRIKLSDLEQNLNQRLEPRLN